MNQEARELYASLKAIQENPRDVGLRAVFADWLEENGEPEEADAQRAFSLGRYDAEQRLRAIAIRYADGDYEGMLRGVINGEYCWSHDSGPFVTDDEEFQKDVRTVTGKSVVEGGNYRCGC